MLAVAVQTTQLTDVEVFEQQKIQIAAVDWLGHVLGCLCLRALMVPSRCRRSHQGEAACRPALASAQVQAQNPGNEHDYLGRL